MKSLKLASVCLALVAAGCGSSGGDAPTLPKANVSKFDFQASDGAFFFQSADHGIKCGVYTRGFPVGVGCQSYLTPIPKDVKDCTPLGGSKSIGIQIVDKKASAYCLAQGLWIGPTVTGMWDAGGQVLNDGAVIEVDGAVCQAKDKAITCTKDGAGFTMSATENKVY